MRQLILMVLVKCVVMALQPKAAKLAEKWGKL
jgi:hypothetical protein